MYCITANVIFDSAFRKGAKVYVLYCNGDAEFPKVRGLSKGGRVITKHIPYKRLENFRSAWIPPIMHLEKDVMWTWESKEEVDSAADRLRRRWSNVRFFDKKGNLIKDGISASEAYKKIFNKS